MVGRALAVAMLVLGVAFFSSGGLKLMSIRQTLTGGLKRSGSQVPAIPAAKNQSTPNPKRLSNGMSRRKADRTLVALSPMPIQTFVLEVDPPVAPKEADLRPTMLRVELVRKFGEPYAIATWTDAGTLHERLTYIDQHTYTEVLFRDGRLVWSYTEHH